MKKVTIQEIDTELRSFPSAYALKIRLYVYVRSGTSQLCTDTIAVSYHTDALVNFRSRIKRLSKPDLKAWLIQHDIIPDYKAGPEYLLSQVELTIVPASALQSK